MAVRPIFVGDIQGCADELEELLARAAAAFGSGFRLYQVGDLVNRGPANLRVLRRMRRLWEDGRAQLVLGNHDLNLVRIALGLRELGPLDSVGDVLEAPDRDAWVDWLRCLPLVIADELGGNPFAMVHASVHPEWELPELLRRAARAQERLADPDRRAAAAFLGGDPARDRDLDTLMRITGCRSVSREGGWGPQPPGQRAGERAWHAAWSERGHRYGVVYGHWALQGLHVAPGLRGLDTGCVHHGRGHDGILTAWLPEPGRAAFFVPDGAFWHVRARCAYYVHRDAQLSEPELREESD